MLKHKLLLSFGSSFLFTALISLSSVESAGALSLGSTWNEPYSQPSKTADISQCDFAIGATCYDLTLPNSLAELIIQTISQHSNVSPEQISITRAQHVVWPNGCRGNYSPGMMCTMALVSDGWLVTAEGNTSRWQYRISGDNSSALMISHAPLRPIAKDVQPLPSSQPVPEPSTLLGSIAAIVLGNWVRKRSKHKQGVA